MVIFKPLTAGIPGVPGVTFIQASEEAMKVISRAELRNVRMTLGSTENIEMSEGRRLATTKGGSKK